MLTGIQKDLSQPVQSAIAAASYDGAGKIGLQFKRRFWETEDDILKRTMRARSPDERQRLALEQGARIHPQYMTEFETAFSVSWPRVPWSRGSWLAETAAAHAALAPLQTPDGRVFFAGDYMTTMMSWMQGAFESAREVTMALHRRVAAQ